MTYRHIRNVRGFFSDYYLGSVFGRGEGRGRKKRVSDRDTDAAYRRFLRIYQRAEGRAVDAHACRENFCRPLLRDVLGFHLGTGEDRIHRVFSSAESEAHGNPALLLAYCGAWEDDLDAGRGTSTPMKLVEKRLAEAGLDYAFLLSGERVRLVRAPGDGPRGAYLEVDLAGLAADDDSESFAVFYRLFLSSQFQPDAEAHVPVRKVEKESREHAEKVSEDLKGAVFMAAESLVRGLLEDAVVGGEIARPEDVPEQLLLTYRDAALTALYRILFILYAEARDPRLDEHRLYRDVYSIHGLVDELLRNPTQEWPQNRTGLWARIKALFAIYDRGLPQITPWENIPPRGGDFFKADTAEGRILDKAQLPDQTTARMILDLTTSRPHRGVGRERVSFRELDIESLGAVYEGLLEFEPRIARETTIELRVQGRAYALSAEEVLRLCRERSLGVKGDFCIVQGTAAETLHPEAPSEDDEESEDTEDADLDQEEQEDEEEQQEEASKHAEEVDKGIKKGASARLLRRLGPGDFHFVPGAARKGSGSFYTPLPLVKDLVRHAIGPLAEGRSAAEIEGLRVVDPACGSAHFLVEAMRFLGKELHRAYVREYPEGQPPAFTRGKWDADWRASDEEARAANSEARAWCKRRIAERCLFGIDLNPTAVNLARVSLWIESLAGDRPLTYFEHHVRCGNSLLGSWLDRLDYPPLPSLEKKSKPRQGSIFADQVRKTVQEAARIRQLIDVAGDEGAVEPESIDEQQFKEHQRRIAQEKLANAELLFDLRCASAFVRDIWTDWGTLTTYVSEPVSMEKHARAQPWWQDFERVRQHERFFHWELEFPEVFLDKKRSGFDTVVGNPPWEQVIPTKHEFYARHDVLIRAYKGNDLERRIAELHKEVPGLASEFDSHRSRVTTIAHLLRQGGDFPLSEARSQAAHEDVSKYFLDRATRLCGNGGTVGFVVPSVVYNGDGCVGIRRFLLTEAAITRFYGFENRWKIFPIHSSYKFVNLVLVRKKSVSDAFLAAFMRHDIAELAEDEDRPWMVRLTAAEINSLSPETFALLEYRSSRDQEIVRKMHEGQPTLGDEHPGGWGVRFISWRSHETIYNTAEDKDLFTDPKTGRLWSPERVLGSDSTDAGSVVSRMRENGFWPVFEGKHVEQFVVGLRSVRWWISIGQAERKYGALPTDSQSLVFRDTASNTNERTCIAAVLPAGVAGSDTLSGMITRNVDANATASVLNSLCFDYALRMRTAGTHVSFTYMRPLPVPPAWLVNGLPRILTRYAWESGIGHITEQQALWPQLWAVNRAVAEAYGLGPGDFAHILGTFPVLARKRPEFFAYLKQRTDEWKREQAA